MLKLGQKVRVREFGVKEQIRRVVLDRGKRIVVCNQIEFVRARRESRAPDGIAFPKEAVSPV